jgi:hypothetical protein
MPETPLTVRDAAAWAGVTPSTWRSYVARGQAPAADGHLGATPYWHESTVRAWLDNRPGQGRRTWGLWTVETDATYDQAQSATGIPANRWSTAGRRGLELTTGVSEAVEAALALRSAGRVAWLTPGPGKVPPADFALVAGYDRLTWDARLKASYT